MYKKGRQTSCLSPRVKTRRVRFPSMKRLKTRLLSEITYQIFIIVVRYSVNMTAPNYPHKIPQLPRENEKLMDLQAIITPDIACEHQVLGMEVNHLLVTERIDSVTMRHLRGF